jgi:hypothetical protein
MRLISPRQRRRSAQKGKPHRAVGLSHQTLQELAALLTLLVLLTALAWPWRLLLLLLTRFLLAALLLATLLLTTLLLLTRLLVWILIHCTFLSNIGSKRHLDRSRPMAKDNACRWHLFPCTRPLKFEENVFGTCRCHRKFPIGVMEEQTMGRYMLLWLLGVPIPILVLIWLFGGLH